MAKKEPKKKAPRPHFKDIPHKRTEKSTEPIKTHHVQSYQYLENKLLAELGDEDLKHELNAVEGKPTKFRVQELTLIEYMLFKGYTDYLCAYEMNQLRESNKQPIFTLRTFQLWKQAYPEYFRYMDEVREKVDKAVTTKLMESIMGEVVWEDKPIVVSDGVENGSHVEVHRVYKKMPVNVQGALAWLKARQPEIWNNPTEVILKTVRQLSDAELDAEIRKLAENTIETTSREVEEVEDE
jgi:hypothetical protein